MVTTPKYASTVILYRLRDGNHYDFEIFLIQRAKNMRFLGGFHAFPGGRLEEEDLLEASLQRCRGLDRVTAHQRILDKQTNHQDINLSLAFWITAIRELFEEVGILLAYDRDINLIDLSEPAVRLKFESYRQQLIQKQITFLNILQQEDLFYAVDKLFYFRHFITPDLSPIRYDTRFYIAQLPRNQIINPSSSEYTASEWIDPRAILKRYRKRMIKLIPPQYSCISKLKKVANIDQFCNSLF
jgi:8-oxo-dGTP pyrophosphatase MutT (NUDIX family)